jgi:hypothetical protein
MNIMSVVERGWGFVLFTFYFNCGIELVPQSLSNPKSLFMIFIWLSTRADRDKSHQTITNGNKQISFG